MIAIILAAGIGSRMSHISRETPKCLIEINNKTILENQIDILNKFGITEVYVVIGNQGDCWTKENQEKIRKITRTVIINNENISTQSSYSLKLAFETAKKDDFLIIDGDLVFSEETIKKLLSFPKGVMAVSNKDIQGNKIKTENSKVTEISRDISDSKLTFMGLIKMPQGYWDLLENSLNNLNNSLEIGKIINELLPKIEMGYLIDNSLINVNTLENLLQARNTNQEIAIIWDFDGVIFDSAPMHLTAYKQAFSRLGLEISDKDYYENDGLGAQETFKRISKEYHKPLNFLEWHGLKKKTYQELIKSEALPIKGVEKIIKAIHKDNIKQAIASSSNKDDLIGVLKKLNLYQYFDIILTQEDVSKGKPNPEIFIKAAEKLKIKPQNCLVFEDSIYGIKAAKQAGMKCIAVTIAKRAESDLSEADMIISDYDDIELNKLKNLFKK